MLGVPTMFVAALVALATDAESTASFVAWGFPLAVLYLTGALHGVVNFLAATGAVLGGFI